MICSAGTGAAGWPHHIRTSSLVLAQPETSSAASAGNGCKRNAIAVNSLPESPPIRAAQIAMPATTACPREARRLAALLACDPAQPALGGPPLDDEHRGLLVEVRVHDLGDVGAEAVSICCLGDRPASDRLARDLRLARPLGLGAFDRVDRGAVQRESRIPAEIRALARVRHGAENE